MTHGRLFTLLVLLIGLPALLRPAEGRSYVTCVDGTPCHLSAEAARPAARCCRSPRSCGTTQAGGSRCVTRTVPAIQAVVVVASRRLLVPSVAAVFPPPVPLPIRPASRAVVADRPPDPYWREPSLGHGSRAPPTVV